MVWGQSSLHDSVLLLLLCGDLEQEVTLNMDGLAGLVYAYSFDFFGPLFLEAIHPNHSKRRPQDAEEMPKFDGFERRPTQGEVLELQKRGRKFRKQSGKSWAPLGCPLNTLF